MSNKNITTIPVKKKYEGANRIKMALHHPAIISPKIFDTVQSIKVSRSNIFENPDGTTSRKHTKYNGKRVVRETVNIEQLQYDLGFEVIIPSQD